MKLCVVYQEFARKILLETPVIRVCFEVQQVSPEGNRLTD